MNFSAACKVVLFQNGELFGQLFGSSFGQKKVAPSQDGESFGQLFGDSFGRKKQHTLKTATYSEARQGSGDWLTPAALGNCGQKGT